MKYLLLLLFTTQLFAATLEERIDALADLSLSMDLCTYTKNNPNKDRFIQKIINTDNVSIVECLESKNAAVISIIAEEDEALINYKATLLRLEQLNLNTVTVSKALLVDILTIIRRGK